MKKLLAILLTLSLTVMTGCTSPTDSSGETTPSQTEKFDPLAKAQADKAAGNYEDAIAGFQSVLDSDAKNYLSYLELADLFIRRNEFQKAYDILNAGKENVDEMYIPTFDSKLLDFSKFNVVLDSDKIPHGKTSFVDGQLEWYHQYEYDIEMERLTSVAHCDGEGKVTAQIKLTFNDRNQPLTSYAYYTDGTIEKLEFEYNSNGQLCKTNEHDATGNPAGYSINEFDANGYKVKETKYKADGSNHWTLVYTHNAAEKSTDLEIYFYGKVAVTSAMKFSDSGYPNSSSTRYKGASDHTIEYDFDYFGNHIRQEVTGEGTLTRVISYNAPLSELY